jgi:hypothetical protein
VKNIRTVFTYHNPEDHGINIHCDENAESPTKREPIEEISEHYKERILNHLAGTQNTFIN